ncbi:transcriptional attenuator, LytR family [Goodfellowiella coeruleoviolacea]|uniref:Transcriptional attenuator, LytR family n=1 Tax=Goodfellowiella coeruleoviolacea TaxID=334858 RepID=A0AAE3KFG9_9PSEU|nr:transcriptional attenuator, LytR family [Goodfellowiella coeruleoviolacea]
MPAGRAGQPPGGRDQVRAPQPGRGPAPRSPREQPRPGADQPRGNRGGLAPSARRRPAPDEQPTERDIPPAPVRSGADRPDPDRPGGDRGDRPQRNRPSANRAEAGGERERPARPGSNRVPPRPADRPPAALSASSGRRRALRAGRTVLAIASVLVLTLTGYAWANLHQFTDLNTTDVISGGEGEKPADGAVDILLVGLDSRLDANGKPLPQEILNELQAGSSEDGGLNTDTMILLHIPVDTTKKTVAISLPRDSYVEIAGDNGKHKLNSAYAFGKNPVKRELTKQGLPEDQVEVKSNEAGAKNLIETIQTLTGIKVDHYAEVNLVGFYQITKAVGGVKVCLRRDVNEPKSGAKFTAGEHVIQGKEALAFVRQRYDLPRTDLDRIVRQQVFMAGLASQVLSAGTLANPARLGSLADAIKQYIVLDKGWDILRFAQQMQGLTGGNIEFRTIPTGNPQLATPEDGEAVEVKPREVQAWVRSLTGAPEPSGAASSTAPANPGNAKITVEVRNATPTEGLAGEVMKSLVAQGFTEGNVDNATNRAKSVVRYGSSADKAGAQTVVEALGGDIAIEPDSNIPAGHVRVFLGTDYTGPGTQGFAQDGGVRLNGLTGLAPQQPASSTADSPDPEDQPITADGVRCVY